MNSIKNVNKHVFGKEGGKYSSGKYLGKNYVNSRQHNKSSNFGSRDTSFYNG